MTCLNLTNLSISFDTIVATKPSISTTYPVPLSVSLWLRWHKAATLGVRGVKGGRSDATVQDEEWGGIEATKRVSMFLFQAFDVPGDWREEKRRRDGRRRRRRRRTTLWGSSVSKSWGGFISCQCGVSLPANWLQRLKVSEVSERNREAKVPVR